MHLPQQKIQALWPHEKLSLPWQTITITRGDSIAKIFAKSLLSFNQLAEILNLPHAKKYLTSLQAGKTVKLQYNSQHQLQALHYKINSDETLIVTKSNTGWHENLQKLPLEKTWVDKSVTIKHNFYNSAHNAGLTNKMIAELIRIFAGTVNLAHDIHSGDHFSLLYPQYYAQGHSYKTGHIAAAELTIRNKTYPAIRFTYPKNHTGYYAEDGHGIQSLFLHAPLHYTHISSFFSWRRFDPVVHQWRPHLGVDFAAKYNTSVESIGDGRVLFVGHDSGYGNAVKIRMGFKYRALYAHLSHFAKGLHRGEYVHKGQIIGYVGSTGWSTGPHLHFGFFVFGIPRNFLEYKMPTGNPVPHNYLLAFRQQEQYLMAKLHQAETKNTLKAEHA